LPENAAYQLLRRMAMDRGKRLAEVAESIITAEEMLAQG
jgi:AmiR/NasT family two-component response regulator